MTEQKKIRFARYVRDEITAGRIDRSWNYNWLSGYGYVYASNFSVYFRKKRFGTKKVVELFRPRGDGSRSSTMVNITEDEAAMLWDLQPIIKKWQDEKDAVADAEWKKKRDALEWWP